MTAFQRDTTGLSPAGGRKSTAATSFEALLSEVEAHGTNRGHASVIALYRAWIAAQRGSGPHLHAAWFNLGVELSCTGDLQGAAEAYETALTLREGFAPAAINLGLLRERSGDAVGALGIWAQATQNDDARVTLLNHRGRLLERLGQLHDAEQLLHASLHTRPAQPDVIQHWIHIRQKMCAWPALDSTGLPHSAETLRDNCGPLAVLALHDDVAVQTRIAAGWIGRKTKPTGIRLSPRRGYGHERLRVGYMSSDFCRHAMSFLIAELFERHDRARFEIYGYCSTQEDDSDIRRRVVAGFDVFRSLRTLPDEAAARQIQQDEIDFLIDLNGLTQGARLQILRWRPAPLQATYLGFIGPVPLPELDFLLCDDFVVPQHLAAQYQPKPLYIGTNYQANDSKREIAPAMDRQACGLPAQGFVFCCFSNHYKITPAMFAAWTSILRRVPGAVLWLTADNQWSCAALRRQAAEAGIDPARLIFAGRVSPASYMARLAAADLFLDTFPYNAGTIASDAIRMGLPLLTQCGQAFAARMAASLLDSLGAQAGITVSAEAYVEKAVQLATDPACYMGYKSLFTLQNWARTVGDIRQLTDSLEDTIAREVRRREAGC